MSGARRTQRLGVRAVRASGRASRRGFTLVEVMVALAVLALGVTGILSMQNAAILSNRRAQEMTLATQIARMWLERIRADANQWNRPSSRSRVSDLQDTQYLCRLSPTGCTSGAATAVNTWFVPQIPALAVAPATPLTVIGAGPTAFDAFGREVGAGDARAVYCVGVRLGWIAPDLGSRQGIVRAEVRVWWYREGVQTRRWARCADGDAAAQAQIGANITDLHAVYVASAIQGNPQ